MTSFSLPWYAIAGAQKGVDGRTPGARRACCSRWSARPPAAGYIDVTCGVPPKQFIRGEWFVSIAALTGAGLDRRHLGRRRHVVAAGISFVIGFTIRVIALYRGWEEPLAKEPKGVYQHSDGRPMLGRKLKGKSAREMQYLGLATDGPGEGHNDS